MKQIFLSTRFFHKRNDPLRAGRFAGFNLSLGDVGGLPCSLQCGVSGTSMTLTFWIGSVSGEQATPHHHQSILAGKDFLLWESPRLTAIFANEIATPAGLIRGTGSLAWRAGTTGDIPVHPNTRTSAPSSPMD
jgi:hypothetical protein